MVRRNRGNAKVGLRSKLGLRGRLAVGAAAAALVGGLGTASLALASPAGALVFVNVPCNGGDPTALIAAINSANDNGGGFINLASGCTYKLTLANNQTDGGNGLPVVASAIALNGNGSTIVRTSGDSFRILEIAAGFRVTVNNLVIAGGSPDGNGGALLNKGNLVLNAAQVTDSTANGNIPLGGGILNDGVLTLNQTRVTNNKTGIGPIASGGGIDNTNKLTLTASLVANNSAALAGDDSGGGIQSDGPLVISNSTVSGNTADGLGGGFGDGGGILSAEGGMTLSNSVVDHNTATSPRGGEAGGGGIRHDTGKLTASNSRVSDNVASTGPTGDPAFPSLPAHGGGIEISNESTLVFSDVTVQGNTVSGPDENAESIEGGGVFTAGTATLSVSTVNGNHAVGENAQGGGIFRSAGTVLLVNTPVTSNSPNNCGNPSTVSGCSG